jgi:hypothetical protein
MTWITRLDGTGAYETKIKEEGELTLMGTREEYMAERCARESKKGMKEVTYYEVYHL